MDTPEGYTAPLHRALTAPLLLGGIPRDLCIVNTTVTAAFALGLHAWPMLALGFLMHLLALWATHHDPQCTDVLKRHLRYRSHYHV